MFRLLAILAIATIVASNAEFANLEKHDNARGTFRYYVGERVDGDRVVAQRADGKQWSYPQNIQLTLKYPTSGKGAVVTYVQVDVNQSSNSGEGYVVSGGIGQTSIGIIIVSYSNILHSLSMPLTSMACRLFE